MVGCESSKQPPWSMAMSTSTEPGFIRDTSWLETSIGRLGAGHEHRPDDQVGVDDGPLDLVRVGRDGLQVPLVDRVGGPQPRDVLVHQQHLGLHAEGDGRRAHARHAGAEHDDLRRVHPGHAAHEHAAAAAVALQVMRPDLRRHPAGDLGHGREQRQRPVGQLDGLVRDRR